MDTRWIPLCLLLACGTNETNLTNSHAHVPEEPTLPEPVFDQTTLVIELDYNVADVSFLVDATGSMGPLADLIANQFAQIADELMVSLPDISFGVGAYRDYNYPGMGSGPDRPFLLLTPQTTDRSRVQVALNEIGIGGGEDLPESTIEAIYQATSGYGYDQNCNQHFDRHEDILPFTTHAQDAFAGQVGGYPARAEGSLGGMGYRLGAIPIIVYATDAPLRDHERHGAPPGGCFTASREMAAAAVSQIDGLLIGVNVGGARMIRNQMTELAVLSNSYFADGLPAVVDLSAGTSFDAFRETIHDAIVSSTDSLNFDTVSVVVLEDPGGAFVRAIPQQVSVVERGQEQDFEIDIRGRFVDEDTHGAERLVIALATNTGHFLTVETLWVYPN